MKIKFLQDYRGVLTNEEYYKKGDVADIAQASALIDAGRAEEVKQRQESKIVPKLPIPKPPPKPAQPKKSVKKKNKK